MLFIAYVQLFHIFYDHSIFFVYLVRLKKKSGVFRSPLFRVCLKRISWVGAYCIRPVQSPCPIAWEKTTNAFCPTDRPLPPTDYTSIRSRSSAHPVAPINPLKRAMNSAPYTWRRSANPTRQPHVPVRCTAL